MREIFLGDLSNLKLFDILRTLVVEKKTGVVAVQGKESGEIYVERGNIVHAETARSSGEQAFFAVMGWRAGKSTFKPDVPAKGRTITAPAEQLLRRWILQMQEWKKLKEVVPSPSSVFRLSLQHSPAEKNIRADQWNILALANGTRTVAEIAEGIGWDEFKTTRRICLLVEAGLLERAEEQRPVRKKRVGNDFFSTIEHELKRVMGPVAPILIEDKLAEFGETQDSLPQDQATLFVELLGEEIPNDLKKKEFVKAMRRILSEEK